jgi:hypothetical protein
VINDLGDDFVVGDIVYSVPNTFKPMYSDPTKFTAVSKSKSSTAHGGWTDGDFEVVEEEAPLKNFIIDVTDVETTIRVGKLLSSDQLKRIIDILGE